MPIDVDALAENEAEAAMLWKWGGEDMQEEAAQYELEAREDEWQGPPVAPDDLDLDYIPF